MIRLRSLLPFVLTALAGLAQAPAGAGGSQEGTPPLPPTTGRTKRGPLVIPPGQGPTAPQPGRGPTTGRPETAAWDRILKRVRETADGKDEDLAMIVAEASEQFDDAWERFRAAIRTVDLDTLKGLVRILARKPGPETTVDMQYLLRNRALQSHTRRVLEALAICAGPEAKSALLEELANPRALVRDQAVDLLLDKVTASDVPALLALSQHAIVDRRKAGIRLLGAIPTPESRARLLRALSEVAGGVAPAAGRALAAQGRDIATEVQAMVRRPAVDQGFGHAALVLAALEDALGEELLTADMVPFLSAEVRGRDSFLRAASAVALAGMLFRGGPELQSQIAEREVIDALLGVVVPKGYFVDFVSCLEPALSRLELLTGRPRSARVDEWQAWWADARPEFRGQRLLVHLDEAAARDARLMLRGTDPAVVVLGPAGSRPAVPKDPLAVRLDAAGLVQLVGELHAQGFMTQRSKQAEAQVRGRNRARTLELFAGTGAAVAGAPVDSAPWFDPLEARVRKLVEEQRWQLYLADAAEWDKEWEFFRQHPLDQAEGRTRFKDLVIVALPRLSGANRDRAIAHLASLPEPGTLLTPADGRALVAVAAQGKGIDESARRILELCILVKDDEVWNDTLALFAERIGEGGRDALARVLSLQGLDRILACLRDRRPAVRAAAAEELATARDPRALTGVVELLEDQDPVVRRAAVFAAGRQRSVAARARVLEFARGKDRELRREALEALGRMGGDDVFPVLLEGTIAEDGKERMAAIQGLCALEDPRAARTLVTLFVNQHDSMLGQLAARGLSERNHLASRSDLRQRLAVASDALRRDLVFLLSSGLDPVVVPDLLGILETGYSPALCSEHLTGLTGQDFSERPDRLAQWRTWWDSHKDKAMGDWLLAALATRKHQHTLVAGELKAGASPAVITELARLLEDAQDWYLRTLCCMVLREITGKDFGGVRRDTQPAQLSAMAERYRGLLTPSATAERK